VETKYRQEASALGRVNDQNGFGAHEAIEPRTAIEASQRPATRPVPQQPVPQHTPEPGEVPQAPPLLLPEDDWPTQTPQAQRRQPVSPPRTLAHSSERRWRDEVVLTTVRLIWNQKLLCVLIVLLAASAGGLNTFLKPKFYIAKASIYPRAGDNPLGDFGFAGVAGLVGSLGLGQGNNSQFHLYEKVIHSRQLIAQLLQMSLAEAGHDKTLLQYLEIEEPNPQLRLHIATEVMRAKLSYSVDAQTPVATISCVDLDPKVAALVVNRAQKLLNEFDIAASTSKAREQRTFIEQRLDEATTNLKDAETRLETFRANNLRIGNAPHLQIEQARLQRELEIEQQIYLTLRKEFELARIEERRALSVVNVLDPAQPPALPAGPSTLKAVVVSGFMGGLLVLFFFVTVAIRPRELLQRLGIVAARR
jgi:hypothetical protein